MINDSQLRAPSIKSVFYALGAITISILGLIYFDGIIKPIVVAVLFWFIIKEIRELFGKIKIRGKSLSLRWRGLFAFVFVF